MWYGEIEACESEPLRRKDEDTCGREVVVRLDYSGFPSTTNQGMTRVGAVVEMRKGHEVGVYVRLVVGAAGVHPVPSRTRQLSPSAPMVLGESSSGRVGHCQLTHNPFFPPFFHPPSPQPVLHSRILNYKYFTTLLPLGAFLTCPSCYRIVTLL